VVTIWQGYSYHFLSGGSNPINACLIVNLHISHHVLFILLDLKLHLQFIGSSPTTICNGELKQRLDLNNVFGFQCNTISDKFLTIVFQIRHYNAFYNTHSRFQTHLI